MKSNFGMFKRIGIFTKLLGLDKLQHFTKMLGVQHLDVLHLRGRETRQDNRCDDKLEKESAKGKRRAQEEAESIEDVETSSRARLGDRVENNRLDQKKKARTKTWLDVVKG